MARPYAVGRLEILTVSNFNNWMYQYIWWCRTSRNFKNFPPLLGPTVWCYFWKNILKKLILKEISRLLEIRKKIPSMHCLLAVMKMGSLFYLELHSKYLLGNKRKYFLLDANIDLMRISNLYFSDCNRYFSKIALSGILHRWRRENW